MAMVDPSPLLEPFDPQGVCADYSLRHGAIAASTRYAQLYAHLFTLSVVFHVRCVVARCGLYNRRSMARLQFQTLAEDNRDGNRVLWKA
jgi:hypothetical protein